VTKRIRLLCIFFSSIAAGVAVFSFPAIPQDIAYHTFADHRTVLGIPNFLNVISNLPFVLIGIYGLSVLRQLGTKDSRNSFVEKVERWPHALFFTGLALTGLGSVYYHLSPDNTRLFWDRLPMAVVFMSFFSAVIAERITVKAGFISLFPFLIMGIGSVIYWEFTEMLGRGDLRPYIMVQYGPVLIIPAILFLFPARYNGSRNLIGVFIFYGLAKFFELLDARIFSLGHIVSGHSLKHLASAVAAFWVIRMIRLRSPISPKEKKRPSTV
jgi:Ceramidase